MSFSLIPECDIRTTEIFAREQLLNYAAEAQRQKIPWALGEVDIW